MSNDRPPRNASQLLDEVLAHLEHMSWTNKQHMNKINKLAETAQNDLAKRAGYDSTTAYLKACSRLRIIQKNHLGALMRTLEKFCEAVRALENEPAPDLRDLAMLRGDFVNPLFKTGGTGEAAAQRQRGAQGARFGLVEKGEQ